MHSRPVTGRSAPTRDLAVILGCWVMLTVLVWPAGEFPLDDDWTYARSVQILVQQGRLDLVFAAVPLVAQVGWGALFSLPLGFSFTALRVSGWVLGAVGLVATYGLLRSVQASPFSQSARRLALLGALMLAINPLYLTLALTFMTDVPSLAVSVAALVLLASGIATGSRRYVLGGGVLLLLALLIRQPAIAVATGIGLALIATQRRSARAIAIGLGVPVASLAVLLGYEYIIRRAIGLPPLYGHPYDPITVAAAAEPIAFVALQRLTLIGLCMGLFALPISLVAAGALWPQASTMARGSALLLAGTTLAAIIALMASGPVHPLGNVVYDLGLGPPLLRDVYLLGLPHLPTAPEGFWKVVAGIAVVGSALLIWVVFVGLASARWRAASSRSLPLLGAVATLIIYSGFLVVSGFLDRYLLWLVPLVLAVVVAAARGRARPGRGWLGAALAFALAFAVFGVAGAHDYFAWNRARWTALDALMRDRGVIAAQIDGGFEFNGWYGYDPAYREQPGRSWWWVTGDEYLVTFGPVMGYAEVARFGYSRWLPPGEGTVLILRRMEGTRSTSGDGFSEASMTGRAAPRPEPFPSRRPPRDLDG